jgi:hypothetical protein
VIGWLFDTNVISTLINVRDVRATGAPIFDPWNDAPVNFPLSPVMRS